MFTSNPACLPPNPAYLQFKGSLERELAAAEADRDAFIADFGQEDYDEARPIIIFWLPNQLPPEWFSYLASCLEPVGHSTADFGQEGYDEACLVSWLPNHLLPGLV